jgi:hypothetical protein
LAGLDSPSMRVSLMRRRGDGTAVGSGRSGAGYCTGMTMAVFAWVKRAGEEDATRSLGDGAWRGDQGSS